MSARGTILVTGDKGYIGSVLTTVLAEKGYAVRGFDTCYYADNLLGSADASYPSIRRDIRDSRPEDVAGVTAIIHLAALSNDPLGEVSPTLTDDINFRASVRLAKLARDAGVKRFIYSSSPSMYGVSNTSTALR